MRLRGINNLLLPYAAWRRSFFVALFFVTLASFLFWLDSFRIYEAEIRVLTIAKSQNTATDQVVENFEELTVHAIHQQVPSDAIVEIVFIVKLGENALKTSGLKNAHPGIVEVIVVIVSLQEL